MFEAEPEEADVMTRPPRNPLDPFFSWRTVGLNLLQGASVLAIVLAVFAVSLFRGQGELETRTLTFTTLIVANLDLILANRLWPRTIVATLCTSNTALWWVLGGALSFLGLTLYTPVLRSVFHFSFEEVYPAGGAHSRTV